MSRPAFFRDRIDPDDILERQVSGMELVICARNDAAYAAMFDALMREVFGFSFAPWLERGLWDARYESYSFIEGGAMCANVCVFKADMLIGGKPVRAHQFGAVATRAGYRGRGCARRLIERMPSRPIRACPFFSRRTRACWHSIRALAFAGLRYFSRRFPRSSTTPRNRR